MLHHLAPVLLWRQALSAQPQRDVVASPGTGAGVRTPGAPRLGATLDGARGPRPRIRAPARANQTGPRLGATLDGARGLRHRAQAPARARRVCQGSVPPWTGRADQVVQAGPSVLPGTRTRPLGAHSLALSATATAQVNHLEA